MSLQQTKKVIRDFLLNKDAEVLSIRGDWGVGKTFFWKEAIKQVKDDPKFCRDKYCYLSLFGTASLAELKVKICENLVDRTRIAKGFSVESLKQNVDKLVMQWGWQRGITQLRKSFYHVLAPVNLEPLFMFLAFREVKDTLICIDDFERKGGKLSTQEVLGLILDLKEERNCKIVLIFSDAKLDENTAKDYAEYREKVIDIDVPFKPTSKESASLVLNATDIDAQLSSFTNKLDITNIRILKRIQRAAHKTVPLLQDFDPLVTRSALQTLALFGRCFYSKDSRFPPYDYVKTYGYHLGKEETPEEQKWEAFLREYEFRETDELDIALSFADSSSQCIISPTA